MPAGVALLRSNVFTDHVTLVLGNSALKEEPGEDDDDDDIRGQKVLTVEADERLRAL